jgi:hypothetical protein
VDNRRTAFRKPDYAGGEALAAFNLTGADDQIRRAESGQITPASGTIRGSTENALPGIIC